MSVETTRASLLRINPKVGAATREDVVRFLDARLLGKHDDLPWAQSRPRIVILGRTAHAQESYDALGYGTRTEWYRTQHADELDEYIHQPKGFVGYVYMPRRKWLDLFGGPEERWPGTYVHHQSDRYFRTWEELLDALVWLDAADAKMSEAARRTPNPPRSVPPAKVEDYLSAAKERAWRVQAYREGASSRETPADYPCLPEGTWKMELDPAHRGPYGREIEELVSFDPRTLDPGEFDWEDPKERLRVEGRWKDAQRYAKWLREGLEPPPISVVETERGTLRVIDGHRRLAAADLARRHVRAWVSWSHPTPSGRHITGLTYELAHPRPPDDLLVAVDFLLGRGWKLAKGAPTRWSDGRWRVQILHPKLVGSLVANLLQQPTRKWRLLYKSISGYEVEDYPSALEAAQAWDAHVVAGRVSTPFAALGFPGPLRPPRAANPKTPLPPETAQAILEEASGGTTLWEHGELEGFGGECGVVAIAINEVLFGGKGKLVAVLNEYLFERGDWVGHVVVYYDGRYWDLEGQKRIDDVEEYAMVDHEDPDYAGYGLPDEEAGSTVGMWEVTPREIKRHLPGRRCPLKDVKKVLRRLRKEHTKV